MLDHVVSHVKLKTRDLELIAIVREDPRDRADKEAGRGVAGETRWGGRTQTSALVLSLPISSHTSSTTLPDLIMISRA